MGSYMARFKDHQTALALRKKGKSYSQIKELLKVSKSTLSYWLRDYPLPQEKLRELRDWNQQRIENYRNTRRTQKEQRLAQVYKKQKKLIFPLNKREEFIAGLFLYWGEGGKSKNSSTTISNTDPSLIKFSIKWFTKILGISSEKLRVRIQLYKDMRADDAIDYWSKTLKIPKNQFTKPYFKKSNRTDLTYKGIFVHGTCNVIINNARLCEKILMGLKSIADYYMRV